MKKISFVMMVSIVLAIFVGLGICQSSANEGDKPASSGFRMTDAQKLTLTRLQLRAMRAQEQMDTAKAEIIAVTSEWKRLQQEYCGTGVIIETSGDLHCSAATAPQIPSKDKKK